jgi:hypothetical protein
MPQTQHVFSCILPICVLTGFYSDFTLFFTSPNYVSTNISKTLQPMFAGKISVYMWSVLAPNWFVSKPQTHQPWHLTLNPFVLLLRHCSYPILLTCKEANSIFHGYYLKDIYIFLLRPQSSGMFLMPQKLWRSFNKLHGVTSHKTIHCPNNLNSNADLFLCKLPGKRV